MIVYFKCREVTVNEFDYNIVYQSDLDGLVPETFTIYVYGHYGEQYDFATVYDFSTFRVLIRDLLNRGLTLKKVNSEEISEFLDPASDALPFD